jgi:phosphate transport system substrate-binding protein
MVKKVSMLLASALLTSALAGEIVQGSGASFPYSIYDKWIKEYSKQTGKKINYEKKGSSAGIKDITARIVDFAGSDKPLGKKKLKNAKVYQFPSVVGAITMSYNLPGIKSGDLKLTGEIIADIALGKISKWNDKKIQEANPSLKLPNKDIEFVHRAEGSGTTYNFTYYLALVSDEWKKEFKASKQPKWPAKKHVGMKGNNGIANYIKTTEYTLGYVDYADATHSKLAMAKVQNKDGKFIFPALKNFQEAAAKASFKKKKHFFAMIANPAGKESYPIVAATFILVPTDKDKLETTKKVTAFYDWAYKNGAADAEELGYVPLPASLTNKVRDYWKENGIN